MHKIPALQSARGIAAISVLLFHSAFIHVKYVNPGSTPSELFMFAQTGVDLFFTISGFVMVVAFQDREPGLKQAITFIRGRLLRIYPTYWVYLALAFTALHLAPEAVNSSQTEPASLSSSILLLPHQVPPLLVIAWSLVHEIWFYVVFAGILLLGKTWRFYTLLAWLATILTSSLLSETHQNPYIRLIQHEFSIEFILGALSGLLYLKSKKNLSCGKIAAPCCLLLGLSGIMYALSCKVIDGSDVIQSISLARALIVGGSYSALLLATTIGNSYQAGAITRFLKKTGAISYSLYLSHVFTLSLCGRAWQIFEITDSALASLVFWACAVCITFWVSAISFLLIEKPLIKLNAKTAT